MKKVRKVLISILSIFLLFNTAYAISKDECIDYAKYQKYQYVMCLSIYAKNNDDINSIWKAVNIKYSYDNKKKECTIYLRFFPDELTNSVKNRMLKDGFNKDQLNKPSYGKIVIK